MTRVISGLVLLALIVGVFWYLPPWGTQIFAGLALVLSLREYDNLVRLGGLDVVPGVGAVLSVVMYVALLFLPVAATHVLLVGAVVVGGALVLRGRVPDQAVAVAAAMLFPVVYLGMGVATVPLVREAYGAPALMTLFLTQIGSDTGQYYAGRTFGRAPLAKALSPKKTREGAIGGLVTGAVVMVGFGRLWLPGLPAWQLALLGVAVAIVGIAGDLFESMLKRSADVKDSSNLIPGHGGMLDRIDALLFTMPLYYVALQWLWPAVAR
ncbi:phosphatidate cytidylyltransferase [Luteitalea sp. TBR-22]|uniref:phosphatidate cytidylyltransferase n=1 Tax=Luteitalea sp. TBR-22 TaxID=2802971 RepID=UPI001AF57F36|nr:phosphatidate cytidylyltransferase [Luteitalea sp. TBR-22]BCS31536.1 phosphatidate cytidylyltransferase [Luteitalea sp. TBR-22]